MKAKNKMSEFFLELFSEEIPPKLQTSARKYLLQSFINFFDDNKIDIKGNYKAFSTPNRLIINIDKIPKIITKKSEEVRGPSIDASDEAKKGFIRSHKIDQKQIYEKKNDKGTFYFFMKSSEKVNTYDLLKKNLPNILGNISWNKSMKWGNYDLSWGRPLKSILAIFDTKKIEFNFHHLKSSNFTVIDKDLEEKKKIFNNFKSYNSYFKSLNILIDQDKRKLFIKNELSKIANKNNSKLIINENLLDEISNIVEKPKILQCEFDKRYLDIPEEIIITTMQNHQKYFPIFDKKSKITNIFFVVADINDKKGLVRLGNERVLEARLNDAEFFWKKNKSQNLVKEVSNLKKINYFNGLGTYFDKVQRIRKLSGYISDEMLISKEKIEIASTVCKVDLMSDLVGEFPELQGLMGGYFASFQGFDKDVCQAISEHYLPMGMEGKTPKNSYSIALSLSDKIDSLVGFFGINLKPTSSKDPYALRRMAISILRLILENEKNIKIRDLINYSFILYKEQSFNFDVKKIQKELSEFMLNRFKNYLKEKQIRHDIIESSIINFTIDDLLSIFKKSVILNKSFKNEGGDVISIYKRSSKILIDELKNINDLNGSVDVNLFKNDYEKILHKKIQEIIKYFSNNDRNENYGESLKILSSAKKTVDDFFDNVIVNDKDYTIKKNRLELLKMLCTSFENYLNFSKIEV